MNDLNFETPSDELCTETDHTGVSLPAAASAEGVESVARLFSTLGDPGRLRVLLCLWRGEACVSELSEALDEGMSTVSQRLKLLHREGFVRRRREGKHIYYSFTDAHISELLAGAFEHADELREGRL